MQRMRRTWLVNGVINFGVAVALILQVIATADGITHVMGWNSFASWFVAIAMGWMPLIGTATGMYGAITVWEWPWYAAATLFTWPIILVVARFGIAISD